MKKKNTVKRIKENIKESEYKRLITVVRSGIIKPFLYY